jgi:hypothetical protein
MDRGRFFDSGVRITQGEAFLTGLNHGIVCRRYVLASDHKYLRICDLCQELAFGTQRGLSQICNSYNSFVFIVL